MKRNLLLLFTSLVLASGCGSENKKQDPAPAPAPPPTSTTASLATVASQGATYTAPGVTGLQNSEIAADGSRVYYILVSGKTTAKGLFEIKYYIPGTNDLSKVSRVALSITNSKAFAPGSGTMTYKTATINGTNRFVINGTFKGTVGEYKDATGTLKDVVVY